MKKVITNDPFNRYKPKKPEIDISKIKIESHVPLKTRRNVIGKYDHIFRKMNVGDSFTFEAIYRDRIHHAAAKYAKKYNSNMKFAIRRTSEFKCRIWRTE